MINQVLQKKLLCLDLCNHEPHIATKKYIVPSHLGEYLITSLFVEIVTCNYAFSKDHQSILHTLPPFVVETTCVL
jgi:hypothetical protein